MDRTLKELEAMTREERVALYNRPGSDHQHVTSVTYELQPGVTWGEVYARIRQGMAKSK